MVGYYGGVLRLGLEVGSEVGSKRLGFDVDLVPTLGSNVWYGGWVPWLGTYVGSQGVPWLGTMEGS